MPDLAARNTAAAEKSAKAFEKAAAELHALNRNVERLINTIAKLKEVDGGPVGVAVPAPVVGLDDPQ